MALPEVKLHVVIAVASPPVSGTQPQPAVPV